MSLLDHVVLLTYWLIQQQIPKFQTHELRISGPINDTMSFTAGAFMSDLELTELNLFNYPGSVGNDITYAANYALTDTSVNWINK